MKKTLKEYWWCWAFCLLALIMLLFLALDARAGLNVVTLSDLQNRVRSHLATDADPYHPNDTLTNFINTACREVASYGTIARKDTIIVKSDTTWVPLNDDCLEIFCALPCTASGKAKYDGIYPLGRIEFKDWNRIAGSTEESHSKYYAFFPAHINPQDGSRAGATAPRLYLCPSWGLGDDSIWVFYYAQATELSSANDTCTIPYSYIPLVEYYATALAYARAHNFNEAAWWFAQYDRARQEKGLLKQLDFIVKTKVIE